MTPGQREFHRPARVYPAPVENAELLIPAPPPLPAKPGGGVVQVLIPVLGSMGMFGFALVLGDTRYLIMAGALAGAMLISGIAMRTNQARSVRRSHHERSTRYRALLAQTRERLVEAGMQQRAWGGFLYPEPADLWSVAVDQKRIWERRPDHKDFLTIRIGTGTVDACLHPAIQRGVDPLTEADPDLDVLATELMADFTHKLGEPTTVDLGPIGCLAIVGSLDLGRRATRAILLQLAVFRAPDDLRAVVAHEPADLIEWSWMQALPHVRGEGGVALTTDVDDLAALLHQISRPRIEHLEQIRGSIGPVPSVGFPRVVVILDDYEPEGPVGRLAIVDELLSTGAQIGITFICVVGDAAHVPSASDATMKIAGDEVVVTRPVASAPRIVTNTLQAPLELCTQIARVLEPLSLRSRTGRATTIDSAGLLELLGVDDKLLDGWAWPQLPAEEHMRTPIGVAEDGTPVWLDLKESAMGGMGPHGILIGATGSGKSELLRTLVLGLAARHTPEDLAFVLVDFKGGATFSRLDRLPHSAGMITNLDRDPALVDRMLEALRGELEHRQRVLYQAGGFDRADEYRAHRIAHPEEDLSPLPALLVVVDEFGELVAAKPEFSDLFAMIGRVGRSLGVHLLLSTQRLEDGKVRKLEGHLRYRLALRTFTGEESMAVLGTKAAAELPPIPGVGYLKVDGSIAAFKAGLVNRPMRGRDQTEMEFLVSAVATAPHMAEGARPVWLSPLPTACDLAETVEPSEDALGWLRVPVGIEDHPRDQSQHSFIIDLDGARGNLAVVGAARTGKSTLLQTFVISAALNHDPADLQIYAIDFGGGGLHSLEDLPHVGGVFSRSNRPEVAMLIRRLLRLLQERSELFRLHRLTDMSGYHTLRRDGVVNDEFGEVVVVIDNWGALCNDLEPAQIESIGELVGSGLHVGVHVVLTAARYQDIKLAIRDNIGGRFELRLGDAIDSEIDRTAARSIPGDTPGRGLSQSGHHVQISLPRLGKIERPETLTSAIERSVLAVRSRWTDAADAPPILMLPDYVPVEDLPAARGQGTVIGLEEVGLGPWEVDLFGTDPHFLVMGDGESGKTNILRRLVWGLTHGNEPSSVQIAVVDYRRRLVGDVPEEYRFGAAATPEAAALLASQVKAEMASRAILDGSGPTDALHPALVVVIDDYDLVASAAGNPMSPLTDHLSQGRDLGLHVVIARRVGGTARASFEPLFQRIRELNTPGVVLSGDPQEGPLLGTTKAAHRAPGRGVWVSRGTAVEVQAAFCHGNEPSDGTVVNMRRIVG